MPLSTGETVPRGPYSGRPVYEAALRIGGSLQSFADAVYDYTLTDLDEYEARSRAAPTDRTDDRSCHR